MMIDKQDRTVNASFDQSFVATAFGGIALAERAATRTSLWRILRQVLPVRQRRSGYEFVPAFASTLYGLLVGGRGFSAGELIRDDSEVCKALGLEGGVPKDCSMHRIYCDAAGIEWRREDDWYDSTKDRYEHKAYGKDGRKFVRGRRRVGEMELADQKMLDSFDQVLCQWVPRLLGLTLQRQLRWGQWIPVFGDATQLEVDGRCFEGTAKDYKGNMALQWQTVYLASYLCAQKLRPGSACESAEMPEMLEQTFDIASTAELDTDRLLGLLDSAYAKKPVFEKLRELKGRYVIGGNKLREHLEKRGREQPESVWKSGWHSNPKYRNVKYCTFYYQAATWKKKEVVVALRYDDGPELFPMQRYHFLFTNLTDKDIGPDKGRLGLKGFGETVFAIYHHKQARENNYKTPLTDMNLHQPPSGRFGANQVLYAVATLAVNLYVALTTSAMHEKQRGIRLTTMRTRYFLIAATVAASGRQTKVRLATAISEKRRRYWLFAFERIKRW